MLFNSLVFLLFGGLFFAVWPLLRGRAGTRWLGLVVFSFVFYGWWDWRFLFLISGTALVNYGAGLLFGRVQKGRKLILVISVVLNLLPLMTFKYLGFAANNVNWLMQVLGIGQFSTAFCGYLILPVGISFYTFQAMSYTIDVYRGELKPTRNVFHFLAYLSMFPQLVAGPIVRAKDLLPQLEQCNKVGAEERWQGLRLIVLGYFKKVVVADTLAPAVNGAFNGAGQSEGMLFWWMIMIMFAYQIYCDFSGYSDIARGLGKWMGYEFPVNFDHPYISRSFGEFWRRWHISLSSWFRDYVYIPLGGSRSGRLGSQGNMWVTMLLSGLWHGAAWTFVIWSALHAFYLSVERVTNWPKRLAKVSVVGPSLATLAVFLLTTIAWVFFRADSFGQAVSVLGCMFNFGNLDYHAVSDINSDAVNVLLIILARQLYFHFGFDKQQWGWIRPRHKAILESTAFAVLIMLCVYMRGPGSAFIYFQF
ncbi:MAG: MBOAT family protein [Sedimentisphaerales bacterium]|nr:MBOAT family protein [Sedimentisphaerales bacterium]